MKYRLDDIMTIAEAADRWNISHNTLGERFKCRTINMKKDIEKSLEEGTIKRYKAAGKKRYEWIITKDKMVEWYGER